MLGSLHAEEVELGTGTALPVLTSSTVRRLQPAMAGQADRVSDDGGKKSMPAATHSHSTETTLHAQQELCYDAFGFPVSLREKAAEGDARRRATASGAGLMVRWSRLLRLWPNYMDTGGSTRQQKTLCRAGIPATLRPRVWNMLLEVDTLVKMPSWVGLYVQLRAQPPSSSHLASLIERDLARTFPTQRDFAQPCGAGQTALRNVLRAYANRNGAVGYCQGMGFITGALLLVLQSEHDAFFALCALMERPRYNVQTFFAPGLPQLRCAIYVLQRLLRHVEPALHEHLCTHRVDIGIFAANWFLTAFAYKMNFALLVRVWDAFLCEGWKPIYRVALAFFILEKRRLMKLYDEGELLMAMKRLDEDKDQAVVLRTAFSIKFRTTRLIRYATEYQRSAERFGDAS